MRKLLSIVLALTLLFTMAVPALAAQSTRPDFPMSIRVFVSEEEIDEVTDLVHEGFDWVYQSGLDEIDGEYFLSFFVWSQEELDYFNNNGYKTEIIRKNSDTSDSRAAATFSAVLEDAKNSADHYAVDSADGFIVGITGHNTTPIQPRALNWDVMFDPTGVSFNEVYGFPNRKGYRTVEEYYGEMFYLAEAYPHLVKLHYLGESWYNPIYVLEICNDPGTEDGRAEWLDLAAQHSREWPANELVMNTAWWLVTQYDKYLNGDDTVEPGIIEVMEDIRTWCMPMYNPDGVWFDQSNGTLGAGTYRANTRPGPDYVTSYNEVLQDYAYGTSAGETGKFYDNAEIPGSSNYPVDLNRNFPYRWGSSDGSSTQGPNWGGSTTRGPAPLSEPENQVLASLVARRMIGADYSGHTYGGLVIYPWDNKKSLAVTDNMNFEELGRHLWSYNAYNDYHERVIYSQSGEGQGFLFGSWRSLGFTYEMGYNYQSAMQDNFVPLYNGHDSYWKVAVTDYQNKNPNITTRISQPSGEPVASAGTQIIPLHYKTSGAAGTGQISEELTAPVVVMMPECVTNEHNINNCSKDVYGNPLPEGECEYHNTFVTTYTTTDLLATTERLNALLADDPNYVNGKILLCYSTSTAANSTEFVLAAQDAGAKAVIFAQVGTSNNANSAHVMTDSNFRLNADTRITIPVALTPRPFARDIHEHVKEDGVTLTLKPEFVPWNTQMMEWERNCYSFLELAKFSKEYNGKIKGTVTNPDGEVVDGAKLDLSLNVYAPILREGVRDVFWWNLDDYDADTNPNGITESAKANFGELVKMYTHPTTGDEFVVREFTHTSYIDTFDDNGEFTWSVVPSTQFDAYMYEGLRQPATSTSTNSTRGIAGGFEVDDPDDPRIGTLLFPNDGYTITATANGAYSDIQQVVVEDYMVIVEDVNFVLQQAISTDFAFTAYTNPRLDIVVPFTTYAADGTPSDLSGVTALVNDEAVAVESLGNGEYTATFNLNDLGIEFIFDCELVIDFEGEEEHSPLVLSGKDVKNIDDLKLSTDAYHVRKDGYANITTEFVEAIDSNTAILHYTFDTDLFKYADFHPAAGVEVISKEATATGAKVVVMISSYDTQNYGRLAIQAISPLSSGWETVKAIVEYVVRDEDGEKEIRYATATTEFSTKPNIGDPDWIEGDTNGDGVVDLIDLSNMIDWFGIDSSDARWRDWYSIFDYNNNGNIDIYDIAYVAQLIK